MNISGYFGWIEKFLFPPGVRQPNLGRIYRLFGALAGSYASDRTWLLRQHFALTCELKHLPRLGRIFDLPRWSFEGDEGYRGRLASAGFELEGRGSLRSFDWFMRGLCGPSVGGDPQALGAAMNGALTAKLRRFLQWGELRWARLRSVGSVRCA